MSRYRVIALALLVALAGCDDSPPPTTPTAPTVPSSLNTFVARVDPLGQVQFFFQLVESSAAVRVTLAAATADGQSRAIDSPLSVRVGAPTMEGCVDTLAATPTAALTAHVSGTLPIGTYCVQVKDTGTLSEPVDVTVRVHIQPSPGETSAGTVTFASNLALDGFSSRSFVSRQLGTITATLDSLGAPAGSTIVMGIGVHGDTQAGCRLGVLARVAPGGQISAIADPGLYCVGVVSLSSDQPQNQTAFSVTVTHP